MKGPGELATTTVMDAAEVNLPFVFDFERSGTCRGAMSDRPEQFWSVVTSHTNSSFSVPSPTPTLHNQ